MDGRKESNRTQRKLKQVNQPMKKQTLLKLIQLLTFIWKIIENSKDKINPKFSILSINKRDYLKDIIIKILKILQANIPTNTTVPNVYFAKEISMVRAFVYSMVCDTKSN